LARVTLANKREESDENCLVGKGREREVSAACTDDVRIPLGGSRAGTQLGGGVEGGREVGRQNDGWGGHY